MGICTSKVSIVESLEYLKEERYICPNITLGLTHTNICDLYDISGVKNRSTRQCLVYKDIFYGLTKYHYDKKNNFLTYYFQQGFKIFFSKDNDKFFCTLLNNNNDIIFGQYVEDDVVKNIIPFAIEEETNEFDMIMKFFIGDIS